MTQFSLKGRCFAIAALLSLLTIAPLARSQSAVDGAIGGNVLDGTGAVVSNASVSVHNLGTNAEQSAATDDSGYYRVIHLQPGVYNVKITAAQHEAAMKKGAKEIKPGAVIYKQGGKLYMIEDSGNEKASQGFQGNFDVDY